MTTSTGTKQKRQTKSPNQNRTTYSFNPNKWQ